MSRPLNPWKLTGYKAGQNVVCKVTNSEPGGYAVLIPKDNLPGFLPTQATLKPGEEILAQFVCVHNNRILLSARFGQGAPGAKTQTKVKWEDHLEDMDQAGVDANLQGQDQIQIENQPLGGHETQPNEHNPDAGRAIITPPPSRETLRPQTFSDGPIIPKQQQAPFERPATTERPAPFAARPTEERPILVERPAEADRPNQLVRPPAAERPPALGRPAPAEKPAPQPVQLTEAEMAFDVWAPQAQPRKFHLKRATDLILPPVNVDTLKEFKIADYDVEWLITDLEGGMRTGCVKASSEHKRSRSAMLLYKGRAVGCIYGCKQSPDTQPTEQSLHEMLTDLDLPDTLVKIYDLPEAITLSMSALFLGYPVQRDDNYDARSYMDYICSWFASKGQTACLAISLPSKSATCLGFIHNGKFCGAFYVEDQHFAPDKEFVYELLRSDKDANVEASILPPEMTSSAVRFGFSLSMARSRRESQ